MVEEQANHLLYDDVHRAVVDAGMPSHEPLEADAELLEYLAREPIPPGSRVLDVGCGCGRNAISLAEMGYHATGIDSSPNAIFLARRLAAARGLHAEFFVADATGAGGGHGTVFDAAIDLRCSHLITDPLLRQRFFGNLYRWLSSGGRYFGMQIGFPDQATAEERVVPEDDQPSYELVLDTPRGLCTYKVRNDQIATLWPASYERELLRAGFVSAAVEYSHDPGRRPCPHRLLARARKAERSEEQNTQHRLALDDFRRGAQVKPPLAREKHRRQS